MIQETEYTNFLKLHPIIIHTEGLTAILKTKALDLIQQTNVWWKMKNKNIQIIKKFPHTWIISVYAYKQILNIITE